MSFERIAGQERAKQLVWGWLAGQRLPHAILICGPAGTGKRRFALELAKALNCTGGGDPLPCDQCASCRRIDALNHPDLHMLLPLPPRRGRRDEEKIREEMRACLMDYLRQEGGVFRTHANIARDHLRLLQREMAYAPGEGSRKIGLIFEAECMHPAGANSLLKILEEPPERAVFILVSSAPERILPTILSRCQRVVLRRLSRMELRSCLRESGLDEERLELAVRLGEGSPETALRIARGEFEELRGQVEAFLVAGIAGKDERYWSILEELGIGKERGRLEQFLKFVGLYLRDLFLIGCGRKEKVGLVDRRDFLERLRKDLPPERIEKVALEVERAFDRLSRNVHTDLVLVDLWRRLRADSLVTYGMPG